MLTIAPQVRIYMHLQPTDMRKSFDGLCAIVRGVFMADPLDGSLFLFVNRRRDRMKVLYWDRDGLALWYKRLESGTFQNLAAAPGRLTIEIDATQLALILGGIDLSSARRRKRFAVAS